MEPSLPSFCLRHIDLYHPFQNLLVENGFLRHYFLVIKLLQIFSELSAISIKYNFFGVQHISNYFESFSLDKNHVNDEFMSNIQGT